LGVNLGVRLFEKTVIGLLGVCCVSLLAVAANRSEGTVYKLPKANFVDLAVRAHVVASNFMDPLNHNVPKIQKYLTVRALSKKFTILDYNFDNILDEGAAVPRILIIKMPRDIREIKTPKDRKFVFFKTILPLVLETNKYILRDRERFLRIKAEITKVGKTSVVDRLWLAALSDRYKVNADDFSEILRRVDIIPPSIALAQAAEESGWGTSRFVLEGNALFGQYTFDAKYSLVPMARDKGKGHNIKAFPSLLDAVRSYAYNLNTHKAYKKFRNIRQGLRRKGYEITGNRLVEALTSYSERGDKYVRTIRSIINQNRLKNLDKAKIQKDFVAIRKSQQIGP
jgi:Bax protein